MCFILRKPQSNENSINEPDGRKRSNDPAEAVNQEIAAKYGYSICGTVAHATKSQGNERDDDEGVKDYGRKYR